MGLNKAKIKSLTKIFKKMRKHSSSKKGIMDFSKLQEEFNKEYFVDNLKGSTKKGRFTTPDGKKFKGKFNSKSMSTNEPKPIKLKGKFSKKAVKANPIKKTSPKVKSEKTSIRKDYGDQVLNEPYGTSDEGGGSD